MVEADLDLVLAVAEIHPEHQEDAAVFEERLALFGVGCAVLARGERLLGYRLSHPWMMDKPPRLNSLLGRLPHRPDTLFLHDLALLPEARGRGYARESVDETVALARDIDLATVSLIAIGGTRRFWAGLGFRERSLAVPDGYGAHAVPMVRDVDGRPHGLKPTPGNRVA